ncbi:hypothetical protein ABBQ38_013605 [Trebouxia sp. C0009 RCD-2024]
MSIIQLQLDINYAHAPVASTIVTFRKTCKRGVPEEALTAVHKPTAESMTAVNRQQLSAGRHIAAARRPQTVADAGWNAVAGRGHFDEFLALGQAI